MKGKYSPYPGDKEPAILEQGEYVLNRNAVKAIGKDKLDEINYEQEPRFLDQNEHRMRHAGAMAQRGGQKLSPQEIAAMQRSQGQGNVQPKQSEFNQYISNVFDPEDFGEGWVAREGRDISKDPDYSKWLEISNDMKAAKFGSNRGQTNWTRFILDPKRKADAHKNLNMGPGAYYAQKIKESGIGMEKFMKMRHDADNWAKSSAYWDNFSENEKNIRRDDWAKQIEKRDYADKKMDEWKVMQAQWWKWDDEKNRLAQASKNASEERNLVNREQQLAHIDKLKAQSDKKWGQMGLPGWEADAPKEAIYSAISNKPEKFGAYLESSMGSKDKPISKYDAIGRAEGMKEMIHKQAVEMFGDENYSAATESERKDIENAQLAIEESKHFALRGYRSPSEVEEDAAKERMIAKAIEPIQKQDSKMKEESGGLKSALSSFAGSLLFGQKGGYVKPKGYLIGGLAAGSMALGGLGRLAGAVKERGGLGQMAQEFGDSAKAGLGRMKEQAAGTDYHFTKAGAEEAGFQGDLAQYGGDIDWDAEMDERNKLSNQGAAGWMSKDALQREWYDETKDFRDDRAVEHEAGAGRAIAEGINEKFSPIASAAAKLGGEGLGIAKQGLQAAGEGLGKVAGAAKEDWAKGKDSKLQKGLGFLSAMGQEAIAPGHIQSRMDQVREQGVNLNSVEADGGVAKVNSPDAPDLTSRTDEESQYGQMTLEDGTKIPSIYEYQKNQDVPPIDGFDSSGLYDYGDGSKWKGDLSEGYDESKKNIGLSDDDEFNLWMNQPTDVARKTVVQPNATTRHSGSRVYNQRGGFIGGIGHYQDGGFVDPHNNSRRLMNQARRRYGRIG